jgi:hypothetical protein
MKPVHRDELSPQRDPFEKMGSLVITGSAIGGVLSIGLIVLVWEALPEVRPILVAALVVGGVFGLILWFRRR